MTVTVVHVIEAIEGGVARHVVNLVRHVDADHLIVVPPERVGGVTDHGAIRALRAAGARVEVLDMRRSPVHPRTLAAVPRVRNLIRTTRPDVVHGHSAIGGAVARLAATTTGVPRVYTPHGLYPSRSAYAIERALGHLTDVLIAASKSEAELVAEQRLVPRDKVVVIPNALDVTTPGPAVLDVRAALRLAPSTPLVGSVARLAPQKAPEVFVRACSRVAAAVPDARFVLVGDGPLARQVRSELAENHLDHRFLLLRDCSDGEALMSQFDVFVLSSRYEAGAPFAAMEAMRAGTPVVITDVIGSRDTIDGRGGGFVVPPEDPDALAGAVTMLLTDPHLRRTVGEAGRTNVIERFNVAHMGRALTDLYQSLARERASRREDL